MNLTVTEQKALSGVLRYLAKDAQEVGGAEAKGNALALTDLFQRVDAGTALTAQQLQFVMKLAKSTISQTESVISRLPEDATEALHRAEAIKIIYGAIIRKADDELQQQSKQPEPTPAGE